MDPIYYYYGIVYLQYTHTVRTLYHTKALVLLHLILRLKTRGLNKAT